MKIRSMICEEGAESTSISSSSDITSPRKTLPPHPEPPFIDELEPEAVCLFEMKAKLNTEKPDCSPRKVLSKMNSQKLTFKGCFKGSQSPGRSSGFNFGVGRANHSSTVNGHSSCSDDGIPVGTNEVGVPVGTNEVGVPVETNEMGHHHVKFDEGMGYLAHIRKTYGYLSPKYKSVIEVFKDFKSKSISIVELVVRIINLLRERDSMVLGLNQFLPKGLEIKIQQNGQVVLEMVSKDGQRSCRIVHTATHKTSKMLKQFSHEEPGQWSASEQQEQTNSQDSGRSASEQQTNSQDSGILGSQEAQLVEEIRAPLCPGLNDVNDQVMTSRFTHASSSPFVMYVRSEVESNSTSSNSN